MKPKKKDLRGLIESIKKIVSRSRVNIERLVNEELLLLYWEIGKTIAEREKLEGTTPRTLILELSKELTKEIGRGFSRSNLFNMRNLYMKYPDVQTLSGHLSWSHYCELLAIEDDDKRSFYEQEVKNSRWSIRELRRQLNSSLFERLLLSKGDLNKKKVIELSKRGLVVQEPGDILKEPYVLEFLGIPENKPVLEKDLEIKLIRHIEGFLLELGRGFMFVGSQKRITIGNKHHYVDMVFYNKMLRAYVLIDLKMNKLKPGDIGQMNTYLNYYKAEINESIDNEPIGIILCADKDEIVAEYALGGLTNKIFASRYVYYLPNKEELIKQVERVLIESREEDE